MKITDKSLIINDFLLFPRIHFENLWKGDLIALIKDISKVPIYLMFNHEQLRLQYLCHILELLVILTNVDIDYKNLQLNYWQM